MFDPNFFRTSEERTGDSQRPFQFNHSQEHKDRVKAHCKRVQREYFDSGLHRKETHLTERIEKQRNNGQKQRNLRESNPDLKSYNMKQMGIEPTNRCTRKAGIEPA